MGMGIGIWEWILLGGAALLSFIAQSMVKSTFAKYSKVMSAKGITGVNAASMLLKASSINDVQIEAVGGSLTDHYSPSDKKLRLSEPVYGLTSISAIGVAAHEAGHAVQHATRWGPLALRSILVPVANIGSRFGPMLAGIGIALAFASEAIPPIASLLTNIGILLFSGAVLFYVITLPVEFNASSRALTLLKSNNVLNDQELKGAKKVLNAAAMTYVASALTAIINLLVLILRAKARRR